ncbi:T9SS type A sorting domain-containing protein [Leptobacterium sp. I13]|uniref:T9SS type A sorting domain-containing protein n=1 Tax=Leptobacterium meishanense TaxID=3128904 RepID=UPI0030ED3E06
MRKIIFFSVLLLLIMPFTIAQTITFNGCNALFENQNYLFNMVTTDATGRNVYETTPISGDQGCGGLGVCEFRIAWNDLNSQWEFLADSGSGDFSSPFLIYANTAASTPNPPSLNLGIWSENTAVTAGGCGGDLTNANSTLTGEVQDTTLGISEILASYGVQIYPNPVSDILYISDKENAISEVQLYGSEGKKIEHIEISGKKDINLEGLSPGMYFIKINFKDKVVTQKLLKE